MRKEIRDEFIKITPEPLVLFEEIRHQAEIEGMLETVIEGKGKKARRQQTECYTDLDIQGFKHKWKELQNALEDEAASYWRALKTIYKGQKSGTKTLEALSYLVREHNLEPAFKSKGRFIYFVIEGESLRHLYRLFTDDVRLNKKIERWIAKRYFDGFFVSTDQVISEPGKDVNYLAARVLGLDPKIDDTTKAA